tara:strand:+ start:763 stop:1155 length:393 start_codon:yes stop_codon:yes gene_type:complete
MVASISKVSLIVVFCFGFLAAQNDLILKKEGSSQTTDQKEKIKRVDKWFAIDKLQHFSYSCLISLGCQYVLVNKYDNSESEALPISTALSFSAGLSKELDDSRKKNGFFSVKDMIANCAGLIVASAIINI